MSKMLTIQPDGTIQTGIDLLTMSKFLKMISAKNPGATLSTKQPMIRIMQGFGPALVQLNQDQPTRRTEKTKDELFLLNPQDTLTLTHDNPNHSISFFVTPNGVLRQAQGSEILLKIPQLAPPNSHPCVQQAYDWMFDGELGQSAEVLCERLVLLPQGLIHKSQLSEPKTPDDDGAFLRCQAFLDRVPQAQDNLDQMISVSPKWAALLTPQNGVRPWDTRLQEAKEKDALKKTETLSLHFQSTPTTKQTIR